MLHSFKDHRLYVNQYKACGVLFRKKINNEYHYLFIIENRHDNTEPVVHIIGGKREPKEYPLLTIARETWEETNKLVDKIDCLSAVCGEKAVCKKYWYNRGKYVLYIANCPEQYENIDKEFNETTTDGNQLVWISEKEIKKSNKTKNHEFINSSNTVYKYSSFAVALVSSIGTFNL